MAASTIYELVVAPVHPMRDASVMLMGATHVASKARTKVESEVSSMYVYVNEM